jgi:hypothetical protein
LLALVSVAGLGLGACAQTNTPTEYNDVTQQNFLETCTNHYYNTSDGTIDPSAPTGDTVVKDYAGASTGNCECQYDVFVQNMSIDDFTTLNTDLKSDPDKAWNGLPQDIKDKLGACPTTGSPSASTSTSESTTTTGG